MPSTRNTHEHYLKKQAAVNIHVVFLVLALFFLGRLNLEAKAIRTARTFLDFTTPLPVHAQVDTPKAELKVKAEDFWRAFEKADAVALEAFFKENLPAEKLQQVPARDRARRLTGLRQELGSRLNLIRILSPSPEEITLILANERSRMFRLSLLFENQGDRLWLRGLTVDEASPEDLAPPLPAMNLEQALKGIEREIEKAVQEDRFSGVVLVARDFAPLFFKAFGLASREFSVPNRTDTRFNLGSINKIFTKIAIARLARQGKLSLDDKLGKFLPDYPNPEAREKVTVRHLVSMTSGIGDFFGPEFQKTPKDLIRHNRDYLRFFAARPLAFEPGTGQMYSNGGYVVLGEIISAASGLDYYDYVKKNIFEPAGMKDSGWFEADAVVPNVAEGYTRQSDERDKIEQQPGPPLAGGLSSANKPEKNPKRQNLQVFAESSETGKPASQRAESQTAPSGSGTQPPSGELTRVNSGPEQKTGLQSEKDFWRKNIYTRPARGSAAGGGYATAEDLLRLIRALYECRLLDEAWTNWVFTGEEPKQPGQLNAYRSSWSLGIAGGAPGINAALEFEAQTGYTIIVLSNLDPPAATQVARMVRRYLGAVKR